MQITNHLLYREFLDRESEIPRAPYTPELEFYSAVQAGDTKKIQLFYQESFSEKAGLGTLSNDFLQSLKYHFAITAALVSRYCIEGGMDFHTAYNLSDYYILTADQCTSPQALSKLHYTMCMDYTQKMYDFNHRMVYSKHITDCIDYIYEHLHTRITVKTLAEYLHISQSHLSRLFKQEVGIPVSAYIQNKKIRTAQSMLQYSDYSVSDIAAILSYPSHSYFTEIFRKTTGTAPLQYRTSHYRKLHL